MLEHAQLETNRLRGRPSRWIINLTADPAPALADEKLKADAALEEERKAKEAEDARIAAEQAAAAAAAQPAEGEAATAGEHATEEAAAQSEQHAEHAPEEHHVSWGFITFGSGLRSHRLCSNGSPTVEG